MCSLILVVVCFHPPVCFHYFGCYIFWVFMQFLCHVESVFFCVCDDGSYVEQPCLHV